MLNAAPSGKGHSRPMRSVTVPINVRCYPDSDMIVLVKRTDALGQSRHFASQKNSETYRRRTTVKSDRPANRGVLSFTPIKCA